MIPLSTVVLENGFIRMNNNNIEYYNENAQAFYENTVNADMSFWRDKFESYVIDGGRILDAGCGSGRDSRAFKHHGYSVVAFDASREMCKLASELLAQEVWQMRFDEIAFDEEFDGIWACASLLHVSMKELPETLKKLHKALKDKGIMYASFKYGEGIAERGDRTFSNFTEESAQKLMTDARFKIIEGGITSDIRLGRGEEKWVNVIVGKA